MNGNNLTARGLRAAVLAAVLAQSSTASALDVQMYVVTDWLDTECSAGDRGSWDDMVGAWYDAMGMFGHYKQRRYVNKRLNRKHLCDPDSGASNCKDHEYGDAGDAVMFGFHGADQGDHWAGSMRRAVVSGSTQDCTIDAPDGNGAGELLMGDVDTEFLHFSSCNSMDDDNLATIWRLFHDPADSPKNGRRLRQATGFHGMMGVGSVYVADYEVFGLLGQIVPIKDAWLDAHYHPEMSNQKCPIAYAVGSSDNDCVNRLHNESYTDLKSDPSAISTYCYSYFEDCDPAADGVFTPN